MHNRKCTDEHDNFSDSDTDRQELRCTPLELALWLLTLGQILNLCATPTWQNLEFVCIQHFLDQILSLYAKLFKPNLEFVATKDIFRTKI